ncbi:MAG: type II toxin-antitoxin system HicB family antitoxin [bacterium]|nr:type II toxin-antitoxin system HicB family antitoxin [bacterium]
MSIEKRRRKRRYMTLPYTIELTPDKNGVWVASIPLLKGCLTQGDSREDALMMLDEAKELWLETAIEEGITIPEPLIETTLG